MDSSITKIQKRNLTDMQEKFLDVLFGEAKGNPREAARIAGYSDHSYPKVVRNLRKDFAVALKQEVLSKYGKNSNKNAHENNTT